MSEEYDQSKGGEQWGEDDRPNLRYDDFVGRIVQDPKEPPCLTMLSGYLGSSSEEGHVRLYLDEELCRYVEIPEKAIRHTQELSPEQSPLGGSLVWIDSAAEVLHGAAGSERRKATFLEGQIAQDYIGAAGTGGAADVGAGIGAGVGILPTDMGPGCGVGVSYLGPCIPPRTQLFICRTRTGILCSRFGPLCGQTAATVCTQIGPNCHTFFVKQCQPSVFQICVTHDIECQASGFVPCVPPIDTTIWQQGGGQQQQFEAFAAPGGVGGVGGIGGGGATIIQTGNFNCPSIFDNCATVTDSFCPTRLLGCGFTRLACPPSVVIRCPTRDIRCQTPFCPTRTGPRCLVSQVAICDTRVCQFESAACGVDPAGGGIVEQRANLNVAPGAAVAIQPTRFCPSVLIRCPSQLYLCPSVLVRCPPTRFPQACPTLPPGCGEPTGFTGQCETFGGCPSAVDACPSRFGCASQAGCFESQVCGVSQACGGFDPGINPAGGGGPQAFGAEAFAAQPAAGAAALPPTRFCPSQFLVCPTLHSCSTRSGCPSRYVPCQSQLIRCQSQLDACPTRFNCPTLPNGCPGYTRFGVCETVGPCPSAVDACPTRLGCFETAAGCYESVACHPGGGGGGFDPGGFGGGGFGGGF